MTDLLAFFLIICVMFGLVGIEWAIGVNRKPAPLSEPGIDR